MFRRFVSTICALVIAIILCSCASSKRMMRLSPFASKNPQKISYDESQVNLWPLFYNKGNFHSILWPIIDSDHKGFAVRPFFNKDGHEYSILFPFCAWNPQNGDGWCLNTYWNQYCYGSFPLFNIRKHSGFNYILPVWWVDDGEVCGTIGMAFSKEINFVGPLWYDFSDNSGGIFPIFLQSGSKKGYFFPLYDYKKRKDDFRLNLLLSLLGRFAYDKHDYHYRFLTGFSILDNHVHKQGFIPLYYYEKEKGKGFLLTPLGWGNWDNYEKKSSYLILNSYWANEENKHYQMVFPCYYYEREYSEKMLLTPLGGYGWNSKTGETSLVNILGPMYIRATNKAEKESFQSFCFPLYVNYKKDKQQEIVSFPLFWYGKNNQDGFFNILGFVYHNSYSKNSSSTNILWPLCYYKQKPNKMQFGSFPLFNYKKDNKEKNFSILWPLSFYTRKKNEKSLGSFPLFWYNNSEKNKKEEGFLNILGLLWHYQWDRYGWDASFLLPLVNIEYKNYTNQEDSLALPYSEIDKDINRFGFLKDEYTSRYLLFGGHSKKLYTIWKDNVDPKKLNKISELLDSIRNYNQIIISNRNRLKHRRASSQKSSDRKELMFHEKWLEEKFDTYNNVRKEKIAKLTPLLKQLGYKKINLKDNNAIENIAESLREKYCTTQEVSSFRIPLLYNQKNFGDDYKWNVLWLIANGKKYKDYEKVSFLRYLYRYEKTGDVTSRIIFPFISYKSAPKKSKFSFFWRLFNYETNKDKVSGHIFFIPF